MGMGMGMGSQVDNSQAAAISTTQAEALSTLLSSAGLDSFDFLLAIQGEHLCGVFNAN